MVVAVPASWASEREASLPDGGVAVGETSLMIDEERRTGEKGGRGWCGREGREGKNAGVVLKDKQVLTLTKRHLSNYSKPRSGEVRQDIRSMICS